MSLLRETKRMQISIPAMEKPSIGRDIINILRHRKTENVTHFLHVVSSLQHQQQQSTDAPCAQLEKGS